MKRIEWLTKRDQSLNPDQHHFLTMSTKNWLAMRFDINISVVLAQRAKSTSSEEKNKKG